MSNLKEFQNKIREQEKQSVGDIYDECENRGCDLNFIKAFSTRMWFYPIQQTKCFILSKEKGTLDQFRKRVPNSLEQWKIYLSILLKLRPLHDKVGEWKESLSIIDYYEKTGGFKDSEPWGFWFIGISDNDYIDILFERNGGNSELVKLLDKEYAQIERKNKGGEEKLDAIRNILINNGFKKEVKVCDEIFINKGRKICFHAQAMGNG